MRDDIKFNIQFCEEVERHPCLYDYSRADYCNRSAQDQAWQKIAERFDTKAADGKERWKNLRGRYTKYKKQLKLPSGPGAKKIKQYYLANHLQFLDSFLRSRRSKGNIVTEGESTQEEVIDSKDETRNEGTDDELNGTEASRQVTNHPFPDDTPIPTTPLTTPPAERNNESGYRNGGRTPAATLDDVNSSAYEYFEAKQRLLDRRQQSNLTSQPDPDMAFLQSILPDMKAMDDRQKRTFKMGILRLADEILYPVNAPSSSMSAPSRGSSDDNAHSRITN